MSFLRASLFVRGSSTSWVLLHAGLAPSRRLFLTASRRITDGSSLCRTQRPPSDLRSSLPTPTLLRGLSPRDQEGLHLFRYNPSLRAAVITPPELATVSNLFPWFECCLRLYTGGSASGLVLTGLARRSIPAARSVAPWSNTRFVRGHHVVLSQLLRVLSAS